MIRTCYVKKAMYFVLVFVGISLFLLPNVISFAQSDNNPVDMPRTGFEDRDGEDWTTHDEELSFLEEVEKRSERMEYTQIGTSSSGLPLHLVKIGFPKPPSDEDIADKQNILIIGSQHGSEAAGREMTLKKLRDLAFTDDTELKEQLKKTTILFVPTANPDGREANNRTNDDGVDLNRDHLHLYTSEVQALAGVMNQYDPDIIVDAHERSSGPDPEMEVQWVRNLNMDVPLRELNEDLVNNEVRQDLEDAGYNTGLYGGNDHYTLGLETVLSQMAGLRHSLGMLTESSMKLDPNERVDVQMQAIETVLRFHGEKSNEIKEARENAKERKAIAGENQSDPFYFDGADQREPDESDVLDTPACGYLMNTEQANYFEKYADLFSIKTEKVNDEKIFVSMAQPMMTVVPYLLDERAWHNVINAKALDDCSDLESVDPPEPPHQSDPAQYQTTFSDNDIGGIPTDWSEFWLDNSSWEIKDNPRRLKHIVTPEKAGNSKALVWDEVGEDGIIYGDVEVSGVVRADDINGTLFQFGIHMTGETSDENGYYVDLRDQGGTYANQVRINSRTNGDVNLHKAREVPFEVKLNTWYQVVLQREGRYLKAKVWPYGESEPSEFQVTYEDNEFHEGRIGVFHFKEGSINEWAFIGVGTGGESAPRAPEDLFDPEVDTSELQELIEEIEAEGLEKAAYTEESWSSFEDALEEAHSVLTNEDATQDEVDEALHTLTAAYEGLEKIDKPAEEALQEKVDEIKAEELDESNYTDESWQALQTALAIGEELLKWNDIDESIIEKALNNLELAYDELTEK